MFKSKFFFSVFFLLFFFLYTNSISDAAEDSTDPIVKVDYYSVPIASCGDYDKKCCTIPVIKTNIEKVIDETLSICFDAGIFPDLCLLKIPGVSAMTSFIDRKAAEWLPSKSRATRYISKWSVFKRWQCPGGGDPAATDPNSPYDPYDNCTCSRGEYSIYASDPKSVAESLCKTLSDNKSTGSTSTEYDKCFECVAGGPPPSGIGSSRFSCRGVWTAAGCVCGDLTGFIQQNILRWGISLAGLIALLCIIYCAIKLQLSKGNPEEIQKARERLTSCILGLLLIVFAVFVLRVIGVDILLIPGLG